MGTRRMAKTTGNRAFLALGAVGFVAVALNVAPTSEAVAAPSGHIAASSTTGSVGQSAAAGTSPYYAVKTATVRGLGTVLVDGQGMTLYMFVPDHQKGKSTCYNKCASGWPPLRLPAGVTTPVAAGQAKPALLGTTTRKDGGLQVTYNGWPLYLWEVDTAPGEATGQALNSLGGLWYVLSPKGKVIKVKQKS